MASRAISLASCWSPRSAASLARVKYRDSRANSADLQIDQIFKISSGVINSFICIAGKVKQWGHTSMAKSWMALECRNSPSIWANCCELEDRYFNRSALAWVRAYAAARIGLEKQRRQGMELGNLIVKKLAGPVMKLVSSGWSFFGRRGWLSNSDLNCVLSRSISGDFSRSLKSRRVFQNGFARVSCNTANRHAETCETASQT